MPRWAVSICCFQPELAAKFADCGISIIDSPDEVLAAVVLHYLAGSPAARPDLDAWRCSGAQAPYPKVPSPSW